MIAHFLRGHSWEPSPVFDVQVPQSAVARQRAHRARGLNGHGAPPRRPARLTGFPLRAPVEARPSPHPGAAWAVAHLNGFLAAVEEGKAGGGARPTPGPLYLVDRTEQGVREVVGFRMRGHPLALMGAFVFPRHPRSEAEDGRPSLAAFLSKPPRAIGYDVDPVPPGHTTVFLPHVTESIPAFMRRLRDDGGTGISLDASVIDVAFDLRFDNPSEIRRHPYRGARPARSVFRTLSGHVVSGLSAGLTRTLHRDDRFITLTDAIQHRPNGDARLPTIAVNRSILAVQSLLPEGEPGDAVRTTLAFHPGTASAEHLFGAAYDAG